MRYRSSTSLVSPRHRFSTRRRLAATDADELLDLVPVAVIEMVRGPDGRDRIAYFNRGATELFGYSSQEAVGAEPATLLRTRITSERRGEISAALEQTGYWEGELRPLTKDGRELHIRSRVRAESDGDGTMHRRLIALEDQTWERELLGRLEQANRELAQTNRGLAQTNRELETANRELDTATRGKSRFLANMSHEIRTPMNTIIGMTSLLLDGELDPEQAEFAHVIRTSGEHLLTVVDGILDLSKFEVGLLSLDLAPFSVTDCVERTIEMVARSAADKGLELIRFVAPDVPAQAIGDAGRLRQVLVNLLGNAIKFTDSGKVSLAVSARPGQHDARLKFTVSDTGIGIAPEATAALFQPFVQADGSRTRPRKGTGLGLAISRTLTEMMGGQLSVESKPSEGSAFTAEIEVGNVCGPEPVIIREAVRRTAGFVFDPGTAGRMPLQILVVDDNSASRTMMSRMLSRLGYDPHVAGNGHEALTCVARADYDLLLMDLEMPDLGGIAVTERIRTMTDRTTTRIVGLSAHAATDRRAVALDSGMNDYVTKPLSSERLTNVLREAFDARSGPH
jgi:PAS domain S-box-containing protein